MNLDPIFKDGKWMGQVAPSDYHNSKLAFDHCISKSMLAEFSKSPFKWLYNKDNGIQKSSSGFRFGSLVDCLLLTPEHFDSLYLCEEKEVELKKDGTPYTNGQQSKAQKAKWEELEKQGVTIITQDEVDRANLAANAVREYLKDEYNLELGVNYQTQVAMYHKHRQNGVNMMLTGMIDILPDDDQLPIFDLKTTAIALDDRREVERHCFNFKYPWQAAMYCDLFENIKGVQRSFAFIFVESQPPYCVREVRMDDEEIMEAQKQYKFAIKLYAECVKNNNFVGKILPAFYFKTPNWAK